MQLALDAEVSLLVDALRVLDTAAAAARRCAELAAGERDAPANSAACAALLSGGAVAALRAPVATGLLSDDAASRGAAATALRALGAFTDCYAPAREAVARDADWLQTLCAALTAADPVLVDLAAHVVWYTSRGDSNSRSTSRRGVTFESVIQQVSATCERLCTAGLHTALLHCLGRTAAAKGVGNEVEGSLARILNGAAGAVSNICRSSLPPSSAEEFGSAADGGISRNAAAVVEAGGVNVLTALLARRPLRSVPSVAATALGWCLELTSTLDAATTRVAVTTLVALLSADPEDCQQGDDWQCEASAALLCVCFRSAPDRVRVLLDVGCIPALVALFNPANMEPLMHRIRMSNASKIFRHLIAKDAAREDVMTAALDAGVVGALLSVLSVPYAAGAPGAVPSLQLTGDLAEKDARFRTAFGDAGGVEVLCGLLADNACMVLWLVIGETPANALRMRDCGGIAELCRVLKTVAASRNMLDENECSIIVGTLMTLAENDCLLSCLADLDFAPPLTFIVRRTKREDTRLLAVLLLTWVYSGKANMAVDKLLAEQALPELLLRILQALVNKDGIYLGMEWTVVDAFLFVRAATSDAATAAKLASIGVVPLLMSLLAATSDALAQQRASAALLNLAAVPQAHAALNSSESAATVARLLDSADAPTVTAAREVSARLSAMSEGVTPDWPADAVAAVVAGRELFAKLTYAELSAATGGFDKRERALGGRLLGNGADAEVYYADDLRGAEVAVKRIQAHADAGAAPAELHALDVCHDHVLPIWGVLHDAGFTCLVLPLMECSLHDALRDAALLPAQQRLLVARDIAAGLAALHAHRPKAILHRDLKPGNVLLHRPGGDSWRARIADFGRSRTLTEGGTHVTTDVTGTKCFVCPEYYNSNKARPSSDVYSLGFILLQLVTGMPWGEAFASLVAVQSVQQPDNQGKLKMPLYEPTPSVRDALQRGAAAVPVVQRLAGDRGVNWSEPECAELWRLAALCLQPCGRDRPEARAVCAALQALLAPGVAPPVEDLPAPADEVDKDADMLGEGAGIDPAAEQMAATDEVAAPPLDAFSAAMAQLSGARMDADGSV